MSDFSERINFIAQKALVDPDHLKDMYMGIVEKNHGSPKAHEKLSDEHQNTYLLSAAAQTITRENGMLGYQYALAYMNDDQNELDILKNLIKKIPTERKSAILDCTQNSLKLFCSHAHLPQLQVTFAPDYAITHPTISAEDKALFHKLFKERHPKVERTMEICNARVPFKQPEDQSGSSIKEIFADSQNNENPSEFETFLTMMDELEKKYGMDQWDLENNKYDFPSLTHHEERLHYDSPREAAYRKQQQIMAQQNTPS